MRLFGVVVEKKVCSESKMNFSELSVAEHDWVGVGEGAVLKTPVRHLPSLRLV